MNIKNSSRDKRVNKALKDQYPVCALKYSDAIDVLLTHFYETGQLRNIRTGVVIGLNPEEEAFEVFEMEQSKWTELAGQSKCKTRKGRQAK